MEKKENVWEICPCGEGLIQRGHFSPEEIPAGGRGEYCSVCKKLVWVPIDIEEGIFFIPVPMKIIDIPEKIFEILKDVQDS